MFGLKMKPEKMFKMLAGFGIHIEELIPQAETAAVEWFKKLQAESGAPLTALAHLDETQSHFIISLYKRNGLDLQLYKTFPLKDLKNTLHNLEKDGSTNIDFEPITDIGNGNTTELPVDNRGLDGAAPAAEGEYQPATDQRPGGNGAIQFEQPNGNDPGTAAAGNICADQQPE